MPIHSTPAARLGVCHLQVMLRFAPYIWAFLNSLFEIELFKKL